MGKGELNASQCPEAPDQGHTAQHQRSSPNMLFRLAMVMVAVVSGEGVGVTQFNASFAKALQQLNAASLCPPKSLTLWSCEFVVACGDAGTRLVPCVCHTFIIPCVRFLRVSHSGITFLFLKSGTRCNGSMLGITSPADVAVINLPKDQLLGMVICFDMFLSSSCFRS